MLLLEDNFVAYNQLSFEFDEWADHFFDLIMPENGITVLVVDAVQQTLPSI